VERPRFEIAQIIRHCPKCQGAKQALWVEFLRRFCMHILPKRFVKIRYYGILSSKQKDKVKSLLAKKPETTVKETRQERIIRLTGFDSRLCPVCKTGFMHTRELLPKIRAPTNVLYETKILSC